MQKGFVPIFILLAIIVGVLTTILLAGSHTKKEAVQESPASPTLFYPSEDQIKGWKTYNDPHGEFTFRYPNDWYFQDNAEAGSVSLGSSVGAYKEGTKADSSYGDHNGNEIFTFNIMDGSHSFDWAKANDKHGSIKELFSVAGKEGYVANYGYYIHIGPTKKRVLIFQNNESTKIIVSTLRFRDHYNEKNEKSVLAWCVDNLKKQYPKFRPGEVVVISHNDMAYDDFSKVIERLVKSYGYEASLEKPFPTATFKVPEGKEFEIACKMNSEEDISSAVPEWVPGN